MANFIIELSSKQLKSISEQKKFQKKYWHEQGKMIEWMSCQNKPSYHEKETKKSFKKELTKQVEDDRMNELSNLRQVTTEKKLKKVSKKCWQAVEEMIN